MFFCMVIGKDIAYQSQEHPYLFLMTLQLSCFVGLGRLIAFLRTVFDLSPGLEREINLVPCLHK